MLNFVIFHTCKLNCDKQNINKNLTKTKTKKKKKMKM